MKQILIIFQNYISYTLRNKTKVPFGESPFTERDIWMPPGSYFGHARPTHWMGKSWKNCWPNSHLNNFKSAIKSEVKYLISIVSYIPIEFKKHLKIFQVLSMCLWVSCLGTGASNGSSSDAMTLPMTGSFI